MLEQKTKVKIAYWYYKVGMTQEQIGQKLQFSRQRVNKIISSLVDDGVVDIVIKGLEQENVVLENKLEQRFSLKQAIIADVQHQEQPLLTVLGKKAAAFLDDYIQDGKKIGVSWGVTLWETLSRMRACSKPNCRVVQLVGGLNTSNHAIKPDEITHMLAGKLDCTCSILYAPAIMNNEQARDILIQEDILQQTLQQIHHCDIAVVGIGQLESNATIVSQGYLDQGIFCSLKKTGCVGDICFNHYKQDGDFEDIQMQRRVMGVDIPTLRKIPEVIAVAGGAWKAKAVLGALRTRCIDILIIDSELAAELERLEALGEIEDETTALCKG